MTFLIGLIIIIGLGMAFGSFATMFAYRLPRGESVFGRYFGRKSRCPNCEAILQTKDLIPIFNWFITKGKCRHCGKPISRLYLFIEISMVILFILSYLKIGLADERIILFLAMSFCIVVLTATDYTHKMFPYQILSALLMLGLVARTLSEFSLIPILYSGTLAFIAVLALYKLTFLLAKEKNTAMDYLKLIAISSIWLSYKKFILFLLVSLLIYLVIMLINKKLNKTYYLSYGYCLTLPLAAFILLFPAL